MSLPLAKRLCFERISEWTFYDKVGRLKREGYIVDRDGKEIECDVIQLSKKGFDFLKYDLGELRENRFAAQSVAHDYWATAFQLGPFLTSALGNIEFLTEQQIQCTDDSLLPRWQPKSREHIPDGMTCITVGEVESVFAIEVELNLKPLLRYDKAGHYFDAGLSKVDVVFWLCANTKIAQSISNRLFGMNLRNFGIHHFVLTSDFKTNGGNAIALSGDYKNQSITQIYAAKGYQSPTKVPPKANQNEILQILFPVLKTPQNSKACTKSSQP